MLSVLGRVVDAPRMGGRVWVLPARMVGSTAVLLGEVHSIVAGRISLEHCQECRYSAVPLEGFLPVRELLRVHFHSANSAENRFQSMELSSLEWIP